MPVTSPLVGLILASPADCERVVGGALAQPVNAWSSLAFLVAGAWIASRAVRASGRRVELVVFGAAVASNAIGGLLFHGVQGPVARWIHDLSILSVLLFISASAVSRLLERSTRWTTEVFVTSLAAAGLVLAVAPVSAYPLFGLFGAAAAVSELVEYRHELPAIRSQGLTARMGARLGVLAALLLGGTAFWIGRTGAPLCNPESAFQWHAVWHVLAAAAMALFAYGAIEPHPTQATTR